MMLAPTTLPQWLPMEVAIEAERILYSGYADEALVLRLSRDKRMKQVWTELSRHKLIREQATSKLVATLSNRVDIEPPENCNALATFFWCAYTIAWLEPDIATVSPYDVPIASYKAVAANLRYSAAKLRELQVRFGAQVADDDAGRHLRAIEAAAIFCDETATEFEKLKAARAPLVVNRVRGKREARGYVRLLAVEARRLFGRIGYGTVATVASVALAEEITPAQARKWCTSLD